MQKKKIFIEQFQSPGDILMVTSAIRDFYKKYHDLYAVNVKTTCMPIWENNPYLDRGITKDNCDIFINFQYPLINLSNTRPWHFIHGFRKFMEDWLHISIPQGPFCVDIHLSLQLKRLKSIVLQITGKDQRFWIVNAGHKKDFTCKMWDFARYQRVVDILKDEILFVQVGLQNISHVHKDLNNVINLVGKTTNFRDYIKLMYHSSGVLGGVSVSHHLATMPVKPDISLKNRGNVCIAGGRLPSTWLMYCNLAYIHRCGQLPCCDNGGCWISRIEALNDGDLKDNKLCPYPVKTPLGQTIPLCMDSISVNEVVNAIRRYLNGFKLHQLLQKNSAENTNSIIMNHIKALRQQQEQLLSIL